MLLLVLVRCLKALLVNTSIDLVPVAAASAGGAPAPQHFRYVPSGFAVSEAARCNSRRMSVIGLCVSCRYTSAHSKHYYSDFPAVNVVPVQQAAELAISSSTLRRIRHSTIYNWKLCRALTHHLKLLLSAWTAVVRSAAPPIHNVHPFLIAFRWVGGNYVITSATPLTTSSRMGCRHCKADIMCFLIVSCQYEVVSAVYRHIVLLAPLCPTIYHLVNRLRNVSHPKDWSRSGSCSCLRLY